MCKYLAQENGRNLKIILGFETCDGTISSSKLGIGITKSSEMVKVWDIRMNMKKTTQIQVLHIFLKEHCDIHMLLYIYSGTTG